MNLSDYLYYLQISFPDISEYFLEILKNDMSPAIGAMMALMESLRRDDSTTLQEFIGNANCLIHFSNLQSCNGNDFCFLSQLLKQNIS